MLGGFGLAVCCVDLFIGSRMCGGCINAMENEFCSEVMVAFGEIVMG